MQCSQHKPSSQAHKRGGWDTDRPNLPWQSQGRWRAGRVYSHTAGGSLARSQVTEGVQLSPLHTVHQAGHICLSSPTSVCPLSSCDVVKISHGDSHLHSAWLHTMLCTGLRGGPSQPSISLESFPPAPGTENYSKDKPHWSGLQGPPLTLASSLREAGSATLVTFSFC